jgi:hypothetical protein
VSSSQAPLIQLSCSRESAASGVVGKELMNIPPVKEWGIVQQVTAYAKHELLLAVRTVATQAVLESL